MKSQRQKLPNQVYLQAPSKKQLDYAVSLGIHIPEKATKSDMQALIDRALDEDRQASESLRAYAEAKGVKFSVLTGNRYLHNLIFDTLDTMEKAAFFSFCVYKFHFAEVQENWYEHHYKKVFESFGRTYEKDFYFTTSMEEYLGEELITFGKSKKIREDGTEQIVYGGSIHTTAYKLAYNYLEKEIGKLPDQTIEDNKLQQQPILKKVRSFWEKLFPKE
ncbi:MAG: hypothetical protein K0S30_1447 [Clostridia bacterium]|jgi:hypothetical protein|nr:hypothetical protein [Clostridia bacterium]